MDIASLPQSAIFFHAHGFSRHFFSDVLSVTIIKRNALADQKAGNWPRKQEVPLLPQFQVRKVHSTPSLPTVSCPFSPYHDTGPLISDTNSYF